MSFSIDHMAGKRVFSYGQYARVVREWTPAEVRYFLFLDRKEPTSPQEQYLIQERLRNVGYRTISKALVRTTIGCRMHYFHLRRSAQQRTRAESNKVENISLGRLLQIYAVHRGEFWDRIAFEYSVKNWMINRNDKVSSRYATFMKLPFLPAMKDKKVPLWSYTNS